jgi:hypothetical protein
MTLGGVMGKKLTAAIVGVLLTVGFVAAPPAQANSKNDNLYVKIVRAEAPELRGVSKKKLVRGAKTTCRYLRAGGGILDAVDIALNSGLKRNTALTLVAGAVVFYCPEQEGNY